jgi:hypothetical protein
MRIRKLRALPRISVARFSFQEITDAFSDFAGVHRNKKGRPMSASGQKRTPRFT